MPPPFSVACRALVAAALVTLLTVHGRAALPMDRGAAGTWQRLQKLRTIASVLHTTAHPDDEHGGVLTRLSRGDGAWVAMLTLTRGESGDNAIGSELFDALGLIRTEELRRADAYYGVDRQYFSDAIDYGFSKRLEEALVKWGRDAVLRDVVRVIRTERPLVVVSRFQGNERDGHGNHQAAGVITREAFRVAGERSVFPDQIADGLRPWQPLKLYIGGVRENEEWTLRIDSGVYSPWIGDTFANVARLGLSFQRSQNSGRVDAQPGPSYTYYKRVASQVAAPDRESGFFDGIDTRVRALLTTFATPAAAGVEAEVESLARDVDAAIAAFSGDAPSASVEPLARGLTTTRRLMMQLPSDSDAVQALRVKEQQFVDAINAALGIEFTAVAQPPSAGAARAAGLPTIGPVVPGQAFDLSLRFTNEGTPPVQLEAFRVEGVASRRIPRPSTLERGGSAASIVSIHVPADAPLTRPYFFRRSVSDTRYTVEDARQRGRDLTLPPFRAVAEYSVLGVPLTVDATVVRRELQLPYGSALRELAIVPAVALTVSPRVIIVPSSRTDATVHIDIDVTNNDPAGTHGTLRLRLPDNWRAEPASTAVEFTRAGERSHHSLVVHVPDARNRDYTIAAVVHTNGGQFGDGYDEITHRDLETRYLYRPAAATVRGVDVRIREGLRVGYVMGAGDEVPAGIAQLGVEVRLLDSSELAAGDLSRYDAIVTGTRAYGVREDLRAHNQRLLEYVRNGGNLIVLYNTPDEFDPAKLAPFPAVLPADAEEVSEEDAPVTILAPERPEFTTPNRITAADFEGWVEQRGSKFFSRWDAAYTPLIETHDQNQAPQRGGWVTAAFGKGHYTYFAYALHRQLPFGVPGAYRILANLLSLS